MIQLSFEAASLRHQNRRQKVFNKGALRFCGVALALCGGT